jgi:hypothetical protein
VFAADINADTTTPAGAGHVVLDGVIFTRSPCFAPEIVLVNVEELKLLITPGLIALPVV